MADSQQHINIDLQRIGSGIIKDVAAVVAASVIYGMYLILICVSTLSLLKKGWKRSATLLQLIATMTLFLIASFLWAENFGVLIKRIEFALVDTSLGTIDERLALANTDPATRKLRALNDVAFVFEYIIGDLLIVWRVWMLYSRSKVVGLSLLALWLAVFATGLGFVICYIQDDFTGNLVDILGPDPPAGFCISLGSSGWPISLALNVVATILLGRIIWVRRKAFRSIGGHQIVRTSRVDRVLSILAAGSAVYIILGMFRLAVFAHATRPNVKFFIEVVEYMTEIIVAMYPTAVFVFVLNERQIFGHDATSFNVGDVRLSTIAFKRPSRGVVHQDSTPPTQDSKPHQQKGVVVSVEEVEEAAGDV